MLDHHVSNTRYGTINVIDPTAAASGVRRAPARRRRSGSRSTTTPRSALYAALVCDTGRFQYETTTPAVFDLACELIEFDVPVSRLSRQLFEEHRFAYLKLLGEALGQRRARRRAALRVDRGHPGHARPPRRHPRGGRGLIDILRRTTEAEVTCVLKEEADGIVRVSLRSLGDVDVCRSPPSHGGGGHRFAAGFTSTLDIPTVVARIRAAL